ncbi:SRPBCC family protein [Roseovarius salis]|uniref:SRPBCC family protein n=1 Tax=Roseovarius salis TaxID=3376063 RepID=UPI0037CBC621
MEFCRTVDVEAPSDFVFSQMADFNAIERAAMRRGAEVQRIDKLTRTGPGMAWDVSFEFRGKTRELRLELVEYDPPNGMSFDYRSPSLSGRMTLELVALSRNSTRVRMDVTAKAETLTGKLMLQSVKLARKTVNSRAKARMATYAAEIERRYRHEA